MHGEQKKGKIGPLTHRSRPHWPHCGSWHSTLS